MAKAPLSLDELTAQYGPHLNYVPPGGWQDESRHQAEKLVKTHCCFCGQQCGIQLKVRDNRVIGFEPWEEFPFNRGMLCPKGVKRYLQGNHPDRLLDPLMRTDEGFRPAAWDEALDFTARRLRELQEKYGRDSVAVYGGASLTTEKAYLMGKFARVALGTRHIDYNGRLCMVSAGTAYKGALGVDRAPNPWSDIPQAEVLMAIGANIGECAPITTDYIWRARDNGAKLIVADPRFTPIARNADLFLPVRPGTDLALLMAMLHVIIRDGLTDRDFIAAHTTGFEKTAESVEPWNPRRAAEVTGVAPDAIERAAHWIGESRRAMLMHARGLEHHSKGVENCEAVVAIALATGNIGREGAGPIMITGQGNGQGGREHGQKCDQLPGQRSLTDPAARQHVAGVWGISPDELPGPGYTAVEIMNAIHTRRDQRAALYLLQPAGLAAGCQFHARGAGAPGVLRRHRFLPFGNRRACRCRVGRQPAGGRGGRHRQCGGARHPYSEGGGSARQRPHRFRHHLRPGAPPGPRPVFPVSRTARDLRGIAVGVAGRHRRLLRHHLREDRRSRRASSGRAPRWIIPARRACSKTAGSSIPMAKPAS